MTGMACALHVSAQARDSRQKWQAAPEPAWEAAAGGHHQFDVGPFGRTDRECRGPVATRSYGADDRLRDTNGILPAKN